MNYIELQNEIKSAMKTQDKVRLSILRQVLNEVKNIEINERREIEEKDVNDMIKRVLKQTQETLEGSIKVNTNQERTDILTAQVSMLEEYLPAQLEGENLKVAIETIITENGYDSKKSIGAIMKALTENTNGNFDKAFAGQFLNQRLG